MEGLRPRQRAWPSRTPTAAAAAAAGSLAASPAPRLPDNPKPTTRPRPRALTRRRGRGRARRRLPPPAPPPLRAAAQSWSPPPRRRPSLRRSPGDCPPVRTSGPRRGPASAEHRRVRPFGSSGLPLPAAPGSRPRLPSHRPPGGARPAARLEGPPRSRPLGPRASAASLPACLSDLSVSRAAAGSLVFPWALRASWLWLVSLAWSLHSVSSDRGGKELAFGPGCPPERAGEHLYYLDCVPEEPASRYPTSKQDLMGKPRI